LWTWAGVHCTKPRHYCAPAARSYDVHFPTWAVSAAGGGARAGLVWECDGFLSGSSLAPMRAHPGEGGLNFALRSFVFNF
jgi:hypothetical protein